MRRLIITCCILLSPLCVAKGSVDNSVQASKHSVLALKHGVLGTGQLVSGVVATPLLGAGGLSKGLGTASLEAGTSLLNHATGQPLEISELTITADPTPDKALLKVNKDKIDQ